MTAEKIIERIKNDSEKEIEQIQKEADRQATSIINEAKKEAQKEAKKILADGKKQGENVQKILVSKANQDAKRETMNAREKIIEDCFTKAHHKLSTLKESEYRKIVTKLIENGSKKLDGKCDVIISRGYDREIAENMGFKIIGTVEKSGGVILKSSDARVTLDQTFDGIIKRKKEEIRRKVGKLLFSK
jgi:V/A-type H+-transporting ATPase subunit E